MSFPKSEQDEEHETFLPQGHHQAERTQLREKRNRTMTWYLRLLMEAVMAVALVALLIRPLPEYCAKPGKKSPVPTFPKKPVLFVPDQRYLNEYMFATREDTLHVLHNWIPLSSGARGYVQIPNRESYDLPKPHDVYISRTEKGPGYMMSVFHQLHCLSYLVAHYQEGYGGVNLTQEVAHHSAHCFDYIRQSIMCSADTSLEGASASGPGWGHEHQCTDYEALLAWADKNGAYKWRTNMPDEAIL